MVLKFLDLLQYFVGGLALRRAPQTDEEGFIFDNLIDYKAFELLGKVYKITEKVVDYDIEMIVMGLWFKIVEAGYSNFEVLSKFLLHNLASFMLKTAKSDSNFREYEK